MTTATYTKLKNGNWGIRVTSESVHDGEMITVTKKSGETKSETIAKVLWRGNGIALCAIGASSRNGGYRSAGYRSDRAPGGRSCPECGSRECAKAWDRNSLCDED